jgi:hypothetical protein
MQRIVREHGVAVAGRVDSDDSVLWCLALSSEML